MGFGPLRVINEDVVAPGAGFGTHPHRDMEIVTYVIEGALEHKDSMGTGSVITPGEMQRMSAGTGVRHSEYNHSKTEAVHFLQIWVLPNKAGLAPSYEQKVFGDRRQNQLCLVASPGGAQDSLALNQNASIFASLLSTDHEVTHESAPGRQYWVQMISGQVNVTVGESQRQTLGAGDALAAVDEGKLTLQAESDAHFLLFDLPKENV